MADSVSTRTSPSTGIHGVMIINKFGSLIFHDFARTGHKNMANDYLTLAPTFHTLYAIASQLSPVAGPSSGIQEIETDTFRLRCLQTPTGLKFYVVAHPDTKGLESTLNDIYQLFCDYVLKNPFYETDQPVRAAKFEVNLDKLLSRSK